MPSSANDPDRRTVLKAGATVGALSVAGCPAANYEIGSTDGDPPDAVTGHAVEFEVEVVAERLAHPWAIAFLPDDSRLLVTEHV